MRQLKSSFNNEPFTVNYISDYLEAHKAADKLAKSEVQGFGLDIETYKKLDHKKAGLDPHLSGISLIQIYDGDGTVWVFDAVAIDDWHFIFRKLSHKSFVAHYGIFEIKHLTHKGLPSLPIGCSMLLSMLVDRAERSPYTGDEDDEDEEEPSTWKGYGLDAIIGRLFDLRIDKKFQTFDWSIRPLPADALLYAALDAVLTWKIAKVQIPKINQYKMQKHYQVLKEMQHVIADMELAGMYIDPVEHEKLIKTWEIKRLDDALICKKYFGNLNLNSTKQLGEWAEENYGVEELQSWPRTVGGALGFGKSALASKHHLPEIKALLEYKKTAKLLSTYGETLEAQRNPVSHRIHCSFGLGEARTGRMVSRDPNLQNIPRDSAIRNLFVPEEGHTLIVADFNQIELRVAGEVSKDPVIRNAYEKGLDLHSIFASTMYGIPLEDVTKEQRQIAKSANFGAIYGMGANKFITYTLASTDGKVSLSYDKAKHVIDSLWSLYSTYGHWCKDIRARAERTGFVRTPLGKMRKLDPREVYTKAPNTVVQGGAFEVMAVAMINLRSRLRRMLPSVRIVNSVHDEVIVECLTESAPYAKTIIEDCMCYGLKEVFPDATTNGLAKAVICDSWGAGKA